MMGGYTVKLKKANNGTKFRIARVVGWYGAYRCEVSAAGSHSYNVIMQGSMEDAERCMESMLEYENNKTE